MPITPKDCLCITHTASSRSVCGQTVLANYRLDLGRVLGVDLRLAEDSNRVKSFVTVAFPSDAGARCHVLEEIWAYTPVANCSW